ncbi:dihydroorotate dehydrogenase electron transfer subunit [Candidatus Bathyarchaeota archaeon]|nr:dihydroorotate dehydrogenase electron transfer subunit [Candidatus Bathyarchaeota archaeon]
MLKSEAGPTHRQRITTILKGVVETSTIKSVYFRDEPSSRAEPGQFLMVWIPEVDEIPMSISYMCEDGSAAVSVKMVGPATNSLYFRRRNQPIGVRGPYGRGFSLTSGKRALIVSGGAGGAPLGPLSDLLAAKGREFTVVVGAPVTGELLFLDRYRANALKVGGKVIPVTEDGAYGVKGLASEVAEAELKESDYDIIYTCGPEPMIKRLLDLAEEYSVPIQASLERIMKCGIGICGSCVIDSYRVCRDGPVFDGEALREMKELNVTRRDHAGRPGPLQGRHT